jgi:HlyD family secretion protein
LLQAVEAAKTGTLQNLVKRKDIQVAQQQVTNAEAALAAVKAQAGLYTILSPLTGKVTFIGATQGESVDMTTKLVTVANLTRLQLRVGIPSADSSLIHTGQQIEFTSDLIPNKTFTTNITTISPQVDATTGTVLVFADVNNKSGALKDDMTVAATLIVSRHGNVILLPQSAVLSDSTSGAKTVAVVGPDSVLHITPVTTGLVVNGVVEIDSGLSQGEKVAAAGQYGLTDGTKVKASGLNSEQNGTNGS